MKSPDDWTREHYELLAVYDEVKDELLRIPGVTKVGIGVKEEDGELTETMAFRVYVREKIPESDLDPSEVVPRTIRGYPTDIVVEGPTVQVLGFGDDMDYNNYTQKVGGIRIGNNLPTGTGTLGCFAWRLADNKLVMLSNYHVMLDGLPNNLTEQEILARKVKIGQPDHDTCCCCACNEIGTVIAGQYGNLDCAIAELNKGVPYYDKIRRITRLDGTVEQEGTFNGSSQAIGGRKVWKIGVRTGLTRGTITDVVGNVTVRGDPPYTMFIEQGDSGSVLIDTVSGSVVALLKAKQTYPLRIDGVGTHIAPVLAAMQIRIGGRDLEWDTEVGDADPTFAIDGESPFASIAERLRETLVGTHVLEIVAAHRSEVLRLINHSRPGKVAWHRLQGPSYVAAFARSAKEPSYRIPRSIGGITRKRALREMRSMLSALGSEALRRDVERYGDDLVALVLRHDHVSELMEAVEDLELPVGAT